MMKLVPVTEVKRRATEVIASLKKTRTAVMVTDHGREAAVFVDVETWNSLTARSSAKTTNWANSPTSDRFPRRPGNRSGKSWSSHCVFSISMKTKP